MNDKELADNVRSIAKRLAAAMNEAAESGLLMTVEMRPHGRTDYGDGGYKLYSYMPIVSITRVIRP